MCPPGEKLSSCHPFSWEGMSDRSDVPPVIAALVTEPEEAGSSRWYTDRKFTISITAFLLILPLSIPKEIGFQKYARWAGRPSGAGSQPAPAPAWLQGTGSGNTVF